MFCVKVVFTKKCLHNLFDVNTSLNKDIWLTQKLKDYPDMLKNTN